jgi:FkbM family methyltransferase
MIIEKHTSYGYMSYFSNDMAFADSLAQGYIYEQQLVLNSLYNYIKKSNTILDIGAHCGSHTVLYKHINPNCQITCFEPQKKMFDLLCHNIKKNNFKDVYPYNCAVGHKKTEYSMSNSSVDGDNANKQIDYGTNERYNLGGLQVGRGGEKIKIITIDSLDIPHVDFMKIDVEGFEPLVIMGAKDTIKRSMPVIFFEHNHKSISDGSLKELGIESLSSTEDMLSNMGYNISTVDDQGNFLAIPF